MKIDLHEHNREAYIKVLLHWHKSNRTAIVHATGTGKSFIILRCLYSSMFKRKLVIAPSQFILDQFKEYSGENITGTTFLTYAKLVNMSEEEIKDLSPDLIVLDEFHRCGAEIWGQGIQKLLEFYPQAKVLGTSATHIRYLDKGRDMSDELFDGNVASTLTLADAIAMEILPLPKYVSALYTVIDEARNTELKIEESSNSDESKEELKKELQNIVKRIEEGGGVHEVVKKHIQKNNGKYIVFCRNKEHLNKVSKEVVEWFKHSGHTNIKTYRVFTDNASNDKNYLKFNKSDSETSTDILFCIDMLNEGVHVNNIDGVLLLRPTESPIIYYQQIGRCLTVSDSKSPIILDLVNNFRNIKITNFIEELEEAVERLKKEGKHTIKKESIRFNIIDEVKDIINLFEGIETRLEDNWDFMFKLLTKYREEFGDCIVNGKYNVEGKNLGIWVYTQRVNYKKGILSEERVQKLESIGFIWDVVRQLVEQHIKVLEEYYKNNNTLKVSKKHSKEYKAIEYIRRTHRDGNLSREYVKKFEKMGIEWDPLEKTQETYLSIIMEYLKYNGNDGLDEYLKYNEPLVYSWINNQRKKYEKGILNENMIQKLQDLGVEMSHINTPDKTWNERFDLLKEYIRENGHKELKSDEIYKGFNISKWVIDQRVRKGKLSQEKINKMNEIGFIWNQLDHIWNKRLEEFIEYQKKHGNTNVGTEYKEIRTWVDTQRKQYKKGKLEEERIGKLNEAGFKWDIYEYRWELNYNITKQYLVENNTDTVPYYHKLGDIRVGYWLGKQRKAYREGKLEESKLKRLLDIGVNLELD